MKIKINNNEIKTKLKKITDNTYKFVKEKYDRLCTWYKGYENKRALWVRFQPGYLHFWL